MKLEFEHKLNWGHVISGFTLAITLCGMIYVTIANKVTESAGQVELSKQTLSLANTVGNLTKSVEVLQGIATLGQERMEVQAKSLTDLRGVVNEQGKQIADTRETLADVRARSGLPYKPNGDNR